MSARIRTWTPETQALYRAGLTPDREIGRPLSMVQLQVPGHVELLVNPEDRLKVEVGATPEPGLLPAIYWEYSEDGVGEVSHDGILDRFISLRGAKPEAYLSFAQRYGPLGVCEHGLPPRHNPGTPRGNSILDVCTSTQIEPIAVWRAYVERTQAILDIATTLSSNVNYSSTGSCDHWTRALRWTGRNDAPWWRQSRGADRSMLLRIMQYWSEAVGLQPMLCLKNDRFQIGLGGGGVLGALMLQVLLVVARVDGLAFCSECQMAYMPDRSPNPNRRNYCPDCKADGAPNRYAQANSRRKKANERSRA